MEANQHLEISKSLRDQKYDDERTLMQTVP